MKTMKQKRSLRAIAAIFMCMLCLQTIQAQINANFSYNTGPNGLVNFVSTSTGTSISTTYAWSFGDGTYGIGISPSHTYGSNGTYYALVWVCDSAGTGTMDTNFVSNCDTVRLPVIVTNTSCVSHLSFNLLKDSILNNAWTVQPGYPVGILSATWNWGDGTTSTGLYPSHTYSAVGWYSVCLTALVKCDTTISSYTYCDSSYLYKPAAGQVNEMISIKVLNPSVATGVKTNTAQEFKSLGLFPNPAGSMATISLRTDEGSAISIKIINALGQQVLVKNEKAVPGDNTFDLELGALQSGLYYVSVATPTGSHKMLKLIKE